MNAATEPSTFRAATIRQVVLEDYAQIAALQTRNQACPKSRKEWEHLWVENPVYRKLTNWTMGWVAENASREIVGYVGNIPVSFALKGREILGASVHALMTDGEDGGTASALLGRLLNYKTPELVVATIANVNSVRLNDAFHQHHIPTGDWSRSAFWVTNYQGYLASVLPDKGWPQVLSYPAATFLRLRDRLAKADSWTRRGRREIETCSSFDQRFDLFWDDLKRTYPERLLATRSREVLQWHFKHALAQKRAWIATAGDGSRLIAYAVFCRHDSPEHALTSLRLVDFQALNSDMELLVAMLASGLIHCQENGIHVLEAFGFRPEKQSVVDWLAPHRQQCPGRRYLYQALNKALEPELQKPEVWDPSHFDGDATL